MPEAEGYFLLWSSFSSFKMPFAQMCMCSVNFLSFSCLCLSQNLFSIKSSCSPAAHFPTGVKFLVARSIKSWHFPCDTEWHAVTTLLGAASIINFVCLCLPCVCTCGHTWLTILKKNTEQLLKTDVRALYQLIKSTLLKQSEPRDGGRRRLQKAARKLADQVGIQGQDEALGDVLRKEEEPWEA